MIGVAPELTVRNALFHGPVNAPAKLGDQARIAQVWFRISVTLQAPAHAQRFLLRHHFHLVNATVTFNAADTSGDVRSMAEVGIVGKIVHTPPHHRLARFVAVPERHKLRAVAANLRMAVHARLGGRNRGLIAVLHGVVAVAAIKT